MTLSRLDGIRVEEVRRKPVSGAGPAPWLTRLQAGRAACAVQAREELFVS